MLVRGKSFSRGLPIGKVKVVRSESMSRASISSIVVSGGLLSSKCYDVSSKSFPVSVTGSLCVSRPISKCALRDLVQQVTPLKSIEKAE